MGSVYLPKLKSGKRATKYVITYWAAGRKVHENTRTDNKREAQRLLKEREGRLARGEPVLPRVDRVRYEEAEHDLRQHYETSGARNLYEYNYRVAHLTSFFVGRRIVSIGPADATAYASHRQAEGAAPATIRRELSTLGRMLKLAAENGKLMRLPLIRKPAEGTPRAGFFELEQYEALRRYFRLHDRPDLEVAVAIAHTYGWRMQSEVLRLERRHVDLEAGTLRLDPGSTKNDDGRVVHLTPELTRLLAEQLTRVDTLGHKLGAIVPYLFPHLGGKKRFGKRAGSRIRDFRKMWGTGCKAVGVAGRIPHDLRRTAVRNLERAGVARSVATKMTGHRSEAVYRRYAIVSDADLRDAASKLANASAVDRRSQRARFGRVLPRSR